MKVKARALDLSDSALFAPLLDAASNADTLVNNGGAIRGGDLHAVKEARWRVGWDRLVFGYIKLSRAFYAAMQKKGDGVIVNVAGVAADRLDTNDIVAQPATPRSMLAAALWAATVSRMAFVCWRSVPVPWKHKAG